MGTVFQHLPKISEETIYSTILFKKSNKIITMQVSIFCCVLFFIGYVNGSPSKYMDWAKRSDDTSAERMDLALPRFFHASNKMDAADRFFHASNKMDAEIGELKPTTDVEAKFKRVVNGLKAKLADEGVRAFVLFD